MRDRRDSQAMMRILPLGSLASQFYQNLTTRI